MGAWRFALASVVGTSHLTTDGSCQDASACRVFRDSAGREILAAVVADGAGTATQAAEGAQLACDLFLSEMAALLECGGSPASCTREFFQAWQVRFAGEVGARSSTAGFSSRDFACTFLAAVIGPECAAFCQVGDGAIVIATGPLQFEWVFWPQAGEYANQTHFLTDPDADQMLEARVTAGRVDDVALLSDGLQGLAFDFATRTAHVPFWSPMFGTLRSAKDGYDERLSHALASYLGSPRVTERTDDDTTLILASRRIAASKSSSLEGSPDGDC